MKCDLIFGPKMLSQMAYNNFKAGSLRVDKMQHSLKEFLKGRNFYWLQNVHRYFLKKASDWPVNNGLETWGSIAKT